MDDESLFNQVIETIKEYGLVYIKSNNDYLINKYGEVYSKKQYKFISNYYLNNKEIIRNKLKINASINNSKIFKTIVDEYGTFYNYLKSFAGDKIIYEIEQTTNHLSDAISKDLQKRGMKFVGSTIIYSYLQAIGIIYSHDKECYLYKNNKK